MSSWRRVVTSEQKQQIVKSLTEAMVAIEGRTAALPAAGEQCQGDRLAGQA